MPALFNRGLRLFVFSLWLVPTGLAAAPAAGIAPVDRILAVVNDDVVTESELSRRIAETKKQLRIEKITPPPDDVLRRQVLDHLVFERVQLQLASQTGIRVTETDVDRAIESIAQQNKMSVDDFQKFLRREGLDPAVHRASVRNQLTLRQLQEREVFNRVGVTEAEVDSFLENQESRDSVNLSFHLSHIFIAVPESASPEAIAQAKARAEDTLQRLRQGGDFAQAAISVSQGPEALNGGNLGWKSAGQLPELFLSAVKTLAPGRTTDILRSPNGFHILRVNDRRGDVRTERVTQTHARHILLKQSEIQSLDEARIKLASLRERIENGEDFAALARAHSEDPGSAINGGDLGWVSPGQLVPEFEKAMNALKPNGLSAPVRSPFGLHLIQVLERRNQDISLERTRVSARSQIHARKADERYEQWARQLRDEAYVEYLPDYVNEPRRRPGARAMKPSPVIAITPGEPAGIGPDLCIQLAQQPPAARVVLIADATLLQERARRLNLPFNPRRWDGAHENGIYIEPIETARPVMPGKLDAANSPYVIRTLERAMDGCQRGEFDALVTGPIQKSAINDAGIAFTGHTEFLAEQSHTAQPVMMLATPDLRVALVTTHLPLKDVPSAITRARLTAVLEVLHRDLKEKFGMAQPRIRVCGLNPHAGEGGHLGREEIEVIEPVIKALTAKGMKLEGPVPADTAFLPESLKRTDAVLAMYHDQGLAVLKHHDFAHAVNVTLGLPFIRTSVDHGTALELAGSGKADPSSLYAALDVALAIIKARTKA